MLKVSNIMNVELSIKLSPVIMNLPFHDNFAFNYKTRFPAQMKFTFNLHEKRVVNEDGIKFL